MGNNERGSRVMWKGRSIIENNNIKETIALGGGEKQLHSMVERKEKQNLALSFSSSGKEKCQHGSWSGRGMSRFT